jgi:drug/metabolite transporter (DMT)-like permease
MGLLFITGLLAFTAGTLQATATLAMLVTRAIPLVAIGLSAFFFLDERRLIRRGDFLVGFGVSLAGLAGLCVLREGGGDAAVRTTWLGVALLLFCALIWGCYSPLAKAWLVGQRPFVVSAVVFWCASLLAFPAMLKWGNPEWIRQAPAAPVVVMFLSGPVLMGFGEGLYYVSVKRIGLAPAAAASLLVPFFTALYAWPVLGETPTWTLFGFGVVLLAGLGLIIRARARAGALPPDGEPDLAPYPQDGMAAVADPREAVGERR